MALIIKNLGIDPPNYDELSDDEDDFVKDPAQYRDQLPQPYRYIDEILGLFLDDVWEEITHKENARIAEKARKRPPKYECSVQLQELSGAKSLVSSDDGRYIFITCPGGIALVEPCKRTVIDTLDNDQLDIICLKCIIVGIETYILIGLDEAGVCKVFGCAAERLFVMRVLNEDVPESQLKAVKCEASADGDYLGISYENPSSDETLLEVHSLPRDLWFKEIEAIKSSLKDNETTPSTTAVHPSNTEPKQDLVDEIPAEEPAEEDTEVTGRKSTDSYKMPKHKKKKETELRAKQNSALSQKYHAKVKQKSGRESSRGRSALSKETNGRKTRASSRSSRGQSRASLRLRSTGRRKTASRGRGSNLRFTPTTVVMKHRPPEKLKANPGASPSTALKENADPKLLLGSGLGHLLTRPYMEIRQESFNILHRDMFIYRKQEEDDDFNHRECNIHFFSPGLTIPYGIEQPGALKKPCYVGIWWSGSSQFIFYCLTKPVKAKKATADSQDSEYDLKPETVWPQSDVITSSAISLDSSLVALGLRNGIVTIWDKLLSCVRKTVVLSDTPIVRIDFMDPCICPQSNNRHQAYPTSTSCYILVRSADSRLQLVNCGQLDYSKPITIADKATDDDNVITATYSFPARCPEILLRVNKNGKMFLQDVVSTDVLCEIALPSEYELTTPWLPRLSVSAYGQMLYITGSAKTNEKEDQQTKDSLFVFQLRSFPTLDQYWKKSRSSVEFTATSPMDVRISALLTQRVKSSGARQLRLQQRWPIMRQELLRIAHVKSH